MLNRINIIFSIITGESSMARKLRDRVWWPRMDNDAKETVKRCRGCLSVSQPDTPEPMKRRKMPNTKWTDIPVDFMGPLPSGDYLECLRA